MLRVSPCLGHHRAYPAAVRLLSEQLRGFLDGQVWLENRRVLDILRSIELNALKLREHGDVDLAVTIDGITPTIALPMALNASGTRSGVR